MTCYYPDLVSAFDWSCRVGNLFQPIGSTTQIWVVTRDQYGISALVSQTSFRGETSDHQWWRREISAVFSGYKIFYFIFFMEQKNGVPAMLRTEDKLRQALEPAHIQLLSQISKLQGGVKDIVDMRNDLLVR